jgi:peptidase M15-like protein
MVSRQNGDFKRSVLSALAALVAAAVPSLIASTALAETPTTGAAAGNDSAQEAPAKHPAKHTKKAHAKAKADAKPKADAHAKQDAPSKPDEAGAKSKGHDAATAATPNKGKKSKKTASRGAAARKKAAAKKADSDAPQRPCLGAPVTVDRGGLEGQSLALVDCHGAPRDVAREELSLLARPWSAPRPKLTGPGNEHGHGHAHALPTKGVKLPEGEIAPGVRLVDKGLLVRLDTIARHFAGRAISVVSGYRPQSRGSQHQTARALDLRVAGVSNEELVAFCKTLTDTACGYYPNSSFVHVDVRNPGTGSVTWIDASGPHEAARYVRQWPPPDEPANDKAPDEKADPAAAPEPHDLTADPWEIDRDPDEPTSANDAPDHPAALSPRPALGTLHRP